jgi:endonuclease YncB( thermonuclease family)
MLRSLVSLLLLLSALPIAAQTLSGRVVDIHDGDTLTLLADLTRHSIRLAQIDTPERGQDWGDDARQALVDRVFRRRVQVEVTDVDRYGRLVGQIRLDGRDINRELVAEGHAWADRRYLTDASLLDDEQAARVAGLGLWSRQDPVAPWDHRSGERGAVPVVPERSADANLADAPFSCAGRRTCGRMRSCAEARFQLETCGLRRLDGDGDGVPCESLCRGDP